MPDNLTKEQRSYNMSRITGKNTKPEMLVRKFLHSKGFRYRLYDITLPGKPDIVFIKYRTVIFVHGCFWHGHANCKYFAIPKSNKGYWIEKIGKNVVRDKIYTIGLKELGFTVIIIWECQLKPKRINKTLEALVRRLCLIKTQKIKNVRLENQHK